MIRMKVTLLLSKPCFLPELTVLENDGTHELRGQIIEDQPSKASIHHCAHGLGMEWNIEFRPKAKHWDPMGHSALPMV